MRSCPAKLVEACERAFKQTGDHHDVIYFDRDYFVLPAHLTEREGYIPEQDVVYSTMICQ